MSARRILPSVRRLSTQSVVRAEPLDPRTFEPFGGVISSEHQLSSVPQAAANQNTAIKLIKVSPIVNESVEAPSGSKAVANWNMFRCTPPTHLIEQTSMGCVYSAKVMERHPYSTQTFVPMGRDKTQIAYLVIVAPTREDGLPDLDRVKAFTALGNQAVTYSVGTWHAPMVALGETTDFAVLIHENGVGPEDCQEVELDTLRVEFDVPVGRYKVRSAQSEEEYTAQLDEFRATGPLVQDAGYFDSTAEKPARNALGSKEIKFAAERQYYLRNYDRAIAIVDAHIDKVDKRLADELRQIKAASLARAKL